MSHQAPFGHPMHFANPQDFYHGRLQGDFMPPMLPPEILQPPYMPQYLQPHSPYTPPMSMMPNPYCLLPNTGPVNPASAPNLQAPWLPLGPLPTPAPQPQLVPTAKNCPNWKVHPGGTYVVHSHKSMRNLLQSFVVFTFEINILDGEQSEMFHANAMGRILRLHRQDPW
jgi:hypothetical protein